MSKRMCYLGVYFKVNIVRCHPRLELDHSSRRVLWSALDVASQLARGHRGQDGREELPQYRGVRRYPLHPTHVDSPVV